MTKRKGIKRVVTSELLKALKIENGQIPSWPTAPSVFNIAEARGSSKVEKTPKKENTSTQ